MNSGVDFQTWNNNDRGGSSDTYVGAQGQTNLMANDDSLETSANTWVIIFDGTNYTGNCKKIGPSTYLDDLNHTDRKDTDGNKKGDWKNQIQSFILYKQKPAFWDNGSSYTQPSKADLLAIHTGQFIVTENTDFLGANRVFAAPYNVGSTYSVGYTSNGTHMTGAYAINSIETGASAWALIFDDTDANGNFAKITPSNKYADLNDLPRKDLNGNTKGDWKNQIQSFLLYGQQPAFWATPYSRVYMDFATLYSLYPYPTSKSTDSDIEYVVEDSTYKISEPDFISQSTTAELSVNLNDDPSSLPEDGWTKYHIYQEHVNTGSHNDKAQYDAYFDNRGKLVSIQRFEWSSDGAYQIPQSVIKSVDLIAWYLGTTNTLETLGISDEVADAFVDTFNFVCNAFNKIANAVYKATDNGGQFYFLPVICHTLNRICTTALKPFNYPTYTDPNDPRRNYKMSFSNGGFPGALNNALSGNGTAAGWVQKSSATNKNSTYNQVSEFTYAGNHYRTWYQESSVSAEVGLFVSCKIDYEIGDNSKDDHIILLMGFGIPQQGQNVPVLSFAQAIIQFTDGSNTNIQSHGANTDAINAVYNDLKSQLSGVKMSSSQQGRQYLAEVTKANMIAISNTVSFG